MNNYGLILNEIGLRPSLDTVQKYVAPILASLFPTEGGTLDGHHSFVVAYESGKDTKLDMHTDDSDVSYRPLPKLSPDPRTRGPQVGG